MAAAISVPDVVEEAPETPEDHESTGLGSIIPSIVFIVY